MLFSIQEPTSAAIWHLLNNYCIEDAIFLSERLHAEVGSDESAFLLATCYFRNGQIIHAMHTLEKVKPPTPKCRLLLARCYLEQKEYARVQYTVLEGTGLSLEELPKLYQTDTGIAFWLVGESLQRSNIGDDAKEYFQLSLKYNPYIWSSLVALCEGGHTVPLEEIYIAENCPVFCSEAPYMAVSRYIPDTTLQDQSEAGRKENPETWEPGILPRPLESEVSKKKSFSKVCMQLSFESGFREKNIPRKQADLFLGSPSFGTLPIISTPDMEDRGSLERSGNASWLTHQLKDTYLFSSVHTPSPQPFSRESSLTKAPNIRKKHISSHNVIPSLLATGTAGRGECISPDPLPKRQTRKRELRNAPAAPDESEPKRKVMRHDQREYRHDRPVTRSFFRQEAPSLSSLPLSTPALPDSKLPLPSKLPLRSRVRAESAPPTDTPTLLDPRQTEQFTTALVSSLQSVMALLLQLARAYMLLSQYDCTRAVAGFRSIPEHQHSTPWVLCQMAKAHFERADYQVSCDLFEKARKLDPDHVTDMEIYSTALWHLRKDIELSALSEELADSWYLSPQAWCAKGNCMSMHKEHEDAIKFFQRATQVAPRFVYPYTLLGHEYLCTGDLSNARKHFRTAVTINPRHYNALFGLGMVSLREENYKMAEMYFGKAFSINCSSCVICSRLGKVKHSLNKSTEALGFLDHAQRLDPKNPVPLYHKATILQDLNRPQEALEILEKLVKIAPQEVLVHFQMGKVYHKLGKKFDASMKYSWALSLDPGNREIRHAQNTLNRPSSAQEENTPNSQFDIFMDPVPRSSTPK